jgi:hypothetical protein
MHGTPVESAVSHVDSQITLICEIVRPEERHEFALGMRSAETLVPEVDLMPRMLRHQ